MILLRFGVTFFDKKIMLRLSLVVKYISILRSVAVKARA